jgi:exonuclease III
MEKLSQICVIDSEKIIGDGTLKNPWRISSEILLYSLSKISETSKTLFFPTGIYYSKDPINLDLTEFWKQNTEKYEIMREGFQIIGDFAQIIFEKHRNFHQPSFWIHGNKDVFYWKFCGLYIKGNTDNALFQIGGETIDNIPFNSCLVDLKINNGFNDDLKSLETGPARGIVLKRFLDSKIVLVSSCYRGIAAVFESCEFSTIERASFSNGELNTREIPFNSFGLWLKNCQSLCLSLNLEVCFHGIYFEKETFGNIFHTISVNNCDQRGETLRLEGLSEGSKEKRNIFQSILSRGTQQLRSNVVKQRLFDPSKLFYYQTSLIDIPHPDKQISMNISGKFSLMSINLWCSGKLANNVQKIILQYQPDVVCFQEDEQGVSSAIAKSTGYFILPNLYNSHWNGGSLISKYPILCALPLGGIVIRVSKVSFCKIWPFYASKYLWGNEHYKKGADKNEFLVCRQHFKAILECIKEEENFKGKGPRFPGPSFVCGDFNEISHLDIDQYPNNDYFQEPSMSLDAYKNGLYDAFETQRFQATSPDNKYRIDFIYATINSNPIDWFVSKQNIVSDHKFIFSTFEIEQNNLSIIEKFAKSEVINDKQVSILDVEFESKLFSSPWGFIPIEYQNIHVNVQINFTQIKKKIVVSLDFLEGVPGTHDTIYLYDSQGNKNWKYVMWEKMEQLDYNDSGKRELYEYWTPTKCPQKIEFIWEFECQKVEYWSKHAFTKENIVLAIKE